MAAFSSVQFEKSKGFEVAISRIVKIRRPRRVHFAAFRHHEHHALTGTGQKDAIGVLQVNLAVELFDSIPACALELVVGPACAVEAKVSVPDDSCPIKLKPLHLEFGGDILEVIRRADVFLAIKEPFHGVGLYANIYGVWLQSLRL